MSDKIKKYVLTAKDIQDLKNKQYSEKEIKQALRELNGELKGKKYSLLNLGKYKDKGWILSNDHSWALMELVHRVEKKLNDLKLTPIKKRLTKYQQDVYFEQLQHDLLHVLRLTVFEMEREKQSFWEKY